MKTGKDIASIDEKVRKCIWTNALHFAKEKNTNEVKIMALELAHRMYDVEYAIDGTKAEEIAKHFAFIALKDTEDEIRQTAFKFMPANPNTYPVILSRVKDLSEQMRQIAYEKMIECNFKLKYVPEEQRYEVLHSLMFEVCPELRSEADKVIELLIFSTTIQDDSLDKGQKHPSLMYLLDSFVTKSNGLPIHIGSLIIDLVSIGVKRYYNLQSVVQTEAQKSVENLKQLSVDCRNEEGYAADWVKIIKD